jgi:pectinesterase
MIASMQLKHIPRAATILLTCTTLWAEGSPRPNAVVSADGTGDFKTVQEAVNKAPQTTTAAKPWTILIKPGTYRELVSIQREKHFIRLIGEDPEKTVITYNLHASMKGPDGLEIGTFRTPTFLIDADDFTVEKLTIENSAGPVGQALAIRVDGDRVAFRNCKFRGFQDTILLNRGRQYFQNCTITGAVDFIFGGATAYFDRCTLDCVGNGYITAASTPAEAAFGFVFSNCTIRVADSFKVYLGRPWRPNASTIFIGTDMPKGVRPEGWHNWDKPEREQTARYSENHSTGEGADPSHRVKWARKMDAKEAAELTAPKALGGWSP